jgi:hypothetical protein
MYFLKNEMWRNVPPHFKDEGVFSTQFSKVGGLAILNKEDLTKCGLRWEKIVMGNGVTLIFWAPTDQGA